MSDIEKAIDPKLRPAFTLVAALVVGAGVVLVGASTFDARVKRLAREEWASEAQASVYDRERLRADVAALQRKADDLQRIVQDLNTDLRVEKARGRGRKE